MSMERQRIRFQGREWLMIGGAITTPERFSNFDVSFAHLMADGAVMRFGDQIGTKADIEFLGPWDGVEVSEEGKEKALTAALGVLFDPFAPPGWTRDDEPEDGIR